MNYIPSVIEDYHSYLFCAHQLTTTYNQMIEHMQQAKHFHDFDLDTHRASEHTQKAHAAMTRAIRLEALIVAWQAEQPQEVAS